MPAYDYRCNQCRAVFEKRQRITEPAGATCPTCGHTECERLISGGTFHLKGSGWYASDYGGKGGGSTEVASAAASGGCAKPACAGGTCAATAEA
jgi:putative FmdB family regulatory protein